MTRVNQNIEHTISPGVRSGESDMILSWGDAMTWEDYEMLVTRACEPFEDKFHLCEFTYMHPVRLQGHWPEHQVKDTPVSLSYTEWGEHGRPLVLCIGGIANTARRFDYLALGLSEECHVICLDWAGRGLSGWMPTQGDYTLDANVEQVRQLLEFLDCGRATVIGSSLGGSVAMALAARHPELVERLVLNDIGPYIPAERRRRRAQAVARHYVFRRPAELFRRLGASAKNEGPVSEDELLHNTYFQTKWSESNDGRVYRHDPRALQAYAEEAQDSLYQWDDWAQITVPVLVIHGMVSDALLPQTVEQMREKPGVTVMEVPETGHTPALSSDNQIFFLRAWITGRGPEGDFACLNPPAPKRHLFRSSPVAQSPGRPVSSSPAGPGVPQAQGAPLRVMPVVARPDPTPSAGARGPAVTTVRPPVVLPFSPRPRAAVSGAHRHVS